MTKGSMERDAAPPRPAAKQSGTFLWAKILMMIQATISLAVIALLAARAVNIL
jgi:hypothetical protein